MGAVYYKELKSMYVQNGSASVELLAKDQTQTVNEKLIVAIMMVRICDFVEPVRGRWDYSSCAKVGSVEFA